MKVIGLLLLFSLSLMSKNSESAYMTIIFQGNKTVSTSELEAVVGAKRPSLLAFWKEKKAVIRGYLRPKLDKTFELFYKNEGFYDAIIAHKVINDIIVVQIKENRPIRIREIIVQSDLDINKSITLKEGKRFRAKDFTEMKRNLRKQLFLEGYCSPELNTKAYLDLESYDATIKIDLKKQNLCYFGNVTIESSSPTMSDDIILSRLHFEEGDVFNIDKIKESYESLYFLESFDQLNLDYSLNFYNHKPVKITYKEVDKHIHERMGIGYATDLKFQAQYHWEYKNFRGNGKKMLIDALFSKRQKILEHGFFVPNVFAISDYHIDFQNSVGFSEEQSIHNYDERVTYEKLYFSHQSSRWYNSIGLGIANLDIFNGPEGVNGTSFLIYPFMKLVYDRRNSKLNPTKGLYFSHEMEYGLPYSPDSTSYVKYLEEIRAIYTLSDITYSAVGTMGSILVFENNMPESRKFFAGGAFSNRAYGYEQIGITTSSTDIAEIGGFTMANLSLEANFPLYKSFKGAVFSDNTMISDNQGIWEFSNHIVHSAGLGFRYMTPLGPFKIDMGFNINKTSENAVHFQVGQSF